MAKKHTLSIEISFGGRFWGYCLGCDWSTGPYWDEDDVWLDHDGHLRHLKASE